MRHAHLARVFTDGTPVPLFKLHHHRVWQTPSPSTASTILLPIIGAAHLKIRDTSPLTFRAVAFTFVNITLTKLAKVSMVALVFGRSVFEQRKARCRRSRKQDLALIKARILIRKNVLS